MSPCIEDRHRTPCKSLPSHRDPTRWVSRLRLLGVHNAQIHPLKKHAQEWIRLSPLQQIRQFHQGRYATYRQDQNLPKTSAESGVLHVGQAHISGGSSGTSPDPESCPEFRTSDFMG